jgi:hypothetical protein
LFEGEGTVKHEWNLPVGIGPSKEESEHRVTEARKQRLRRIIIRPRHDRNEVQHAKQPSPLLPLHPSQRGEGEASGKGTGEDGWSEGDEDGKGAAELGSDAEGEGDEGGAVALGVADEGDLDQRNKGFDGQQEGEHRGVGCVGQGAMGKKGRITCERERVDEPSRSESDDTFRG